MANKQDIITAIKNLDLFLKIPELKGAKLRLNKNGSPFAFAGGFNMVFQLVHNTKKWAFRVWHVPMGENKDRYLAISKYLTNSKLPYFADFIYDENGLLVNGELTDTIRMEWLDGILLKDYIEKHLNDKAKLESLANGFLEMTKTLKEAKISHGDLQEGNILVDDSGKIRLVDYDSICIPEIEGQKELVTGLKGYQHPSRFKNSKASLKADYFSELIIYISILGIASKPELWEKYQVKDTCYLLFTETDFENIETSKIYFDLKGTSSLIDSFLTILKEYLLTSNYLDLKPFTDYLLPPEILSFQANKEVVLEGIEVEFSWIVENAVSVRIEPEIGNVSTNGKHSFKPQSHFYKLIAEGHFESSEKLLDLKLFPTPLIETIFVAAPIFNESTILHIQFPKFPQVDISINNIQNGIELSEQKFHTSLPNFNLTTFDKVELMNQETKTNWNNAITPLFSRFSNIYKWIFRKNKLS
jgi:serine/threonine protein kinase